jgi:putative ABC transport system permease protein
MGGGAPPAALARVTPVEGGFRMDNVTPLYVATPQLLARYGIAADDVDTSADVLTSRSDAAGLQVVSGRQNIEHPKIQTVALPTYKSAPNSLITTHAIETLGLQVLPAGWLIRTGHALTPSEVDAARRVAAAGGLTIETRSAPHSLSALGRDATGIAVLLVLGVLAMVIGLLRSETASDLRTLTAAGAGRRTRRALSATTAGALALLGAVLGIAGAYLALVAWHRSDLGALRSVPVVNLAVLLAGLPLVAVAAGWLLAGREPAAINRRPLE